MSSDELATLREYIKQVDAVATKLLTALDRLREHEEQQDAVARAFSLVLDQTSQRLLEMGIQEMLDEEIERQKQRNKATPGGVPSKILRRVQ